MDNIGSTNIHYKNISNISVSILLIILQAYLMLIFSGIDLFNFSMIQSNVTRYVVQIIVQIILFSSIYAIIYAIVNKVYALNWIKSHKGSWVKGMWLHIHVKNDIRVGTVSIKQNFNTISAKGHNIKPKGGENKLHKNETTWNYVLSKVIDDNENARDFIACYTANDIANQITKDGMHVLNIVGRDKKTGYANMMVGGFRDTFKIGSNDVIDVGNHAGQLFFFRLSDKCREYLIDNSGFRYDRLFDLHEKAEFAEEPYVIKLKECLSETESN